MTQESKEDLVKKIWGEDKSVESQLTHNLENQCPPLKNYLNPDMNILDVGCGPGTTTIGIAAEVSSGQVVGVDREEKMIEQAKKTLAETHQISNLTFQIGDTFDLDFPDATFNITFSSISISITTT